MITPSAIRTTPKAFIATYFQAFENSDPQPQCAGGRAGYPYRSKIARAPEEARKSRTRAVSSSDGVDDMRIAVRRKCADNRNLFIDLGISFEDDT
jgi:hypothetical protein